MVMSKSQLKQLVHIFVVKLKDRLLWFEADLVKRLYFGTNIRILTYHTSLECL